MFYDPNCVHTCILEAVIANIFITCTLTCQRANYQVDCKINHTSHEERLLTSLFIILLNELLASLTSRKMFLWEQKWFKWAEGIFHGYSYSNHCMMLYGTLGLPKRHTTQHPQPERYPCCLHTIKKYIMFYSLCDIEYIASVQPYYSRFIYYCTHHAS